MAFKGYGMAKTKVKSQSLRNPGQSLDEEIDRTIHDDFMGFYLLAAMLWVITIIEWLAKVMHYPRLPGTYAVAAAMASALCLAQFVRIKKRVSYLRKGRDGEREVAEILDGFRQFGAEVLHDIPGDRGNVDHVVISRLGIFVIESKAWSKPGKVWELDFDGERVHIPGRAPDAAPIVQCRAEVDQIRSVLRESTSKTFPVQGIVVFLKWYVTRTPSARSSTIWVLNPKELEGWISREKPSLSTDEVAMVTLHLKQYVKTLAA